jgi:hypothetical protein
VTNKMVVMKPFKSEKGMLKSGDIVDGSEFRNTRNLVNARYLRPVDDKTPEAPAPGDKAPVMPPTAVTTKNEVVPVDSEDDNEPVAEAPQPKRRRTRKKITEE